MARIWAVVPAAGRGTRFGGELPKQYLVVDGAPLIAHTLAALFAHDAVEGAVVPVSENDPDWPRWTEFAGKPVRASRMSADWCFKGVDQCWSQKERFIKRDELEQARADYEHARRTYKRLMSESEVD